MSRTAFRPVIGKIESVAPGNLVTVNLEIPAGKVVGKRLTFLFEAEAQAITADIALKLPNADNFRDVPSGTAIAIAADTLVVFEITEMLVGDLLVRLITGATGPDVMRCFVISEEG